MHHNPFAVHWRTCLRPFKVHTTNQCTRSTSSQASRIDRITSKLPRRLQKYTAGLRSAPVSHIVSFLILHELTAIVPVVGLFGLFHYTDYVPLSYVSQHFGSYVEEGAAKFERYFKRKGWFGFEQTDKDANDPAVAANVSGGEPEFHKEDVMQRWSGGDGRYKAVVEIALAYAITKALLPVRIVASVWATPWFARTLIGFKRIFARKP